MMLMSLWCHLYPDNHPHICLLQYRILHDLYSGTFYVILPAGMPLLNERKSGFFRLHYDRKLHFRKSLRDCPSLSISCRACALKKMWKRNRKPTNSGSRWPTDVSAHSELQAGAVAAVAALRSPAPRAWRHLIPGYIKNTTLTQLQGRRISEISSRHA